MGPTIKTTSTSARNKLKVALDRIARSRVLVGIPAANASRPGGGINNAEIAAINTWGVPLRNLAHQALLHTNGSPLWRIPPRPFLQPGIEEPANKKLIVDELSDAAKSYFSQDPAAAHNHLERAGILGANAAKLYITSGNLKPNAPSTVRRKGSSQPLIEFGEMRRALTSIVIDE